MNKSYDYGGTQVAFSKPVQRLRSVKKTVHVDSADRDTNMYKNSGDFVIYLPRVYEKVVSIAVKQAEFPVTNTITLSIFDKADPTVVGKLTQNPSYFVLDIEGLNKGDCGSVGADRSAFVDSVFAKFQVHSTTDPLFYTESSGAKICEYYQPSISKLDRLHVTARIHGQTKNQSIYWTDSNFSFSLELETLENSFDDFSSIESRVSERASSGFLGC